MTTMRDRSERRARGASEILLALLLSPAFVAASTTGSPSDLQIGAAQARIAGGRRDAESYNSLAVGLTRKARESGDSSYYDLALEALVDSTRQDPENAETVRISAWVRMGRHEFEKAYRIARRYASTHPADPLNLAVMGDALMELGRYAEAGKAFQSMVDLRPGPASYSRAAYLRELTGDLEGARELMQMALDATAASGVEDRAWLQVQVGHLREVLDDPPAAEASYRTALDSFPGYHYALSALAELALRLGQPEEALAMAREAIAAAPHAERYLVLADCLRALGREKEARAAEDRFEALALANREKPDNENHDLVLYYLERRWDPARALAIARREAQVRRDIQTLDRFAWALHRNGRTRRAARLMAKILGTGTRDPLIVRHAKAIANQ